MIEKRDNKDIHFLWPTVVLGENIGVDKKYLNWKSKRFDILTWKLAPG